MSWWVRGLSCCSNWPPKPKKSPIFRGHQLLRFSRICEAGQLPQDRRSDAKSSFCQFEVNSNWSRPSQPLSNKGPAQSRLELSLSLPTLAITSSDSLRATRFLRYTRLDSIPPPGG